MRWLKPKTSIKLLLVLLFVLLVMIIIYFVTTTPETRTAGATFCLFFTGFTLIMEILLNLYISMEDRIKKLEEDVEQLKTSNRND
jgi:hypothetical protein